jgi:hypothetical protein
VSSTFHDPSTVQNQDLIGPLDGGKAMGDDEDRAAS